MLSVFVTALEGLKGNRLYLFLILSSVVYITDIDSFHALLNKSGKMTATNLQQTTVPKGSA